MAILSTVQIRAFTPTTRWSLIVAAAEEGRESAEARAALEQLCHIYWQPVQQFLVRKKGCSLQDAQDLTQDFFRRFTSADFLKQADPSKGRFRSLIYASLTHLLLDARDRSCALKRGGDQTPVPLDDWNEAEVAPTNAGCGGHEAFFDYDWAALVVRNALVRLEQEFTMRSRQREFEVIRTFLTDHERGEAYAEAAAQLRLPGGTVRAMVHRLRARYRALLREEVAQTIVDLRDLDDEIRYLCRILASRDGLA